MRGGIHLRVFGRCDYALLRCRRVARALPGIEGDPGWRPPFALH